MQQFLKICHYLEADPGPIFSLAVFLLAVLTLGALLDTWAPPY